jgi:pimeloyl-ACP methyl ester carboxylesterase
MKIFVTALLLSIVSALSMQASASAGGGPKPQYFVDESKLPFDALDGAEAYWGVHARAGYQIEVPENWNGSLVVWAHGFRGPGVGPGLELKVDKHPLRDLLIPSGYAWAASSYDRNDYDIASGVKSTHALIKHFNGLVGKPSQILMTGASMGGHITGVLIEQYPQLFDGAMPICGVMGDYALFDYFLDFNLAAQQIGVGGSTYPIDAGTYLFGTVPAIKSHLELALGGWPIFLNADGTNFKNLVEIRSGGDRPNFDEAWFFWNSFPDNGSGAGNFLFDLAVGDGSLPRAPGSAVDNVGTVYQFDADPALTPDEQALNDSIFRIAAEPQTRRKQGLAQVPTITGDIDVPVLTLHNLGDLFVPVLNQVAYASRVLTAGKSDLLVQRAIRGVGHCGFTGNELASAFLDLVAWVDLEQKPAGDNFSDPAEIAKADFGCQFTDFVGQPAHILATPCP